MKITARGTTNQNVSLKLMKFASVIILSLCAILGSSIRVPFVYAQDSNQEPTTVKALDLIGHYSIAICASAPVEKGSSGEQLTAQGKAQLSGLIHQIAELGVSGPAQHATQQSWSALQKNLASAVIASRDCKMSVFYTLRDALLLRTLKRVMHADGTGTASPGTQAQAPTIVSLNSINKLYVRYQSNIWFKVLLWFAPALLFYMMGLFALLMTAPRWGTRIFSRHWLTAYAVKPLQITPGVTRRILFIGYRHRLSNLKMIENCQHNYFGLPAETPDGSAIMPDTNGSVLHQRILSSLGAGRAVVVEGAGGAGKSTLLARLTLLTSKRALAPLSDFLPVLVPANYYETSLIKAISDVLHERDGVAIDESTIAAQLESGRLLVLFDGLSEVPGDKATAIDEIFRTASRDDYKRSRFLIATRPLNGLPADVPIFRLQPLTREVIESLLPNFHLDRNAAATVRHQLDAFKNAPIEPLLFAMAIADSTNREASSTRSQLYEHYFQHLLKVGPRDPAWRGWRRVLEQLADWFLVGSGRRAVGMVYEPLLKLMLADENGPGSDFFGSLRRLYRLPIQDALGVLEHLEMAGILQGGRRWRFAHDTFEEYFAASYIVAQLEEEKRPGFEAWLDGSERVHEFLEVLDFAREMMDTEALKRFEALEPPPLWVEQIKGITDQSLSMTVSLRPHEPMRHERPVNACAFSPDGQLLASASDDKTVRIWEIGRGKERATLFGHEHFVAHCAFSPDGKLLASASFDHSVRLWTVPAGELRVILRGHLQPVVDCAFSPNGQFLASASLDQTIRLWKVANPDECRIFRCQDEKLSDIEITCVVFSPDGQTLASASYDDNVRLWRTVDGTSDAVLCGHERAISACAFHPDGRLLASASDDNTVRLWDLTTRTERVSFRGHDGPVTSCAFHPDGRLLASASDDNTVRLWDVTTSFECAVLRAPEGVRDCTFSPDGKQLAYASGDSLYIVDLLYRA